MSTKRNFEQTARILKSVKPDTTPTTAREDEQEAMMSLWREAVSVFAEAYENENPRFDRERFEAACGMER